MNRYMRAVMSLAAILICGPAWALVQPQQGHLLPDFDVRVGGVLVGATVVAGDEDLLPGRATEARGEQAPTMAQQQAAARLRTQTSAGLKVEFAPATGLPRELHAWGQPLSAISESDPVVIARAFVRANRDLFRLSEAEVDALVVARNYKTHSVFRTVWLGQAVDGILVDDGAIRFNLDSRGRIIWVSAGTLVPGLKVPAAMTLSAEQAVLAAARHIGVDLSHVPEPITSSGHAQQVFQRGPFLSEIVVEPAVFPLDGEQALRAWRVRLEPAGVTPAAWYVVTVDGRGGKLLRRSNLYKYVTNAGLVFNGQYPNTVPPTHPNGVAQSQVGFGYGWPSTTGWTTPAPYGQFNLTIGNNVEAKEDMAGDNEGTIGLFADGGALQEFFFPFQNAWASSTATTDAQRIVDGSVDIPAVVTNLFYRNNQWHDYMHALGMDEAAGNFQMDNFSRGGCGKDSVRADAWDNAVGGSLNNANFGTPPESASCTTFQRPRMQQYLTRFGSAAAPTWLTDTSLDTDVIIHEYSHGTAHRLVGGPFAGCLDLLQSGAMGEGWGDWYAASYSNDPVMGEYSFQDPVAGVREFPMNANPRTYADVCDTGCQVHHDGEVHAAILWDMRTAVGKAVAEQLVTDGMKFAPCSPTFYEYRDALILADQARYGGMYTCAIWQAYFDRGVGVDASSIGGANPIPDFIFNGPICSGNAHLKYSSHSTADVTGGNGDGLFAVGEVIDLDVMLHNQMGVSTATGVSATVTTSTPGITMVTGNRSYPNIPVGGAMGPTAPFQFRIEPGFVCGSKIDFQVAMSWSTFTRSESFTETGGSAPGVVLLSDGAEGTPLLLAGPAGVSSAQAHTGSSSYYMLQGCFAGVDLNCPAGGPCSNTCSSITLPNVVLPPGQAAYLSFWASYNSEVGYDGLFVQVSTDGGVNWQYVDTINYTGLLEGACIGGVAGINGPADNSGLTPWARFEGSLGQFAGQSALIQIVNNQDACVEFEGPYVDDIQLGLRNCTTNPFITTFLSAKANNDGVLPTCTDLDSEPDPGETIDVTLSVTNGGNSTATGLNGTLNTTNPNVTIDPAFRVQAFGDLASGATASRTFRYSIASAGVECFEAADFTLDLTANGGAFSASHPFSETVRHDSGVQTWFDDIEGSQAAWTSSIGPDGSVNDFAIREMACFTAGTDRFFWSTNFSLNAAGCGSGEPDFSPDSDSVLTSPMINLGAAGARIKSIRWRSTPGSFGTNWGGTVLPGLVEVSIDHDGDGVFTKLVSWVNGRNPVNRYFDIPVQNNELGAAVLAEDTVQLVQVRIRLRALGPDSSAGRDSDGMIVDNFELSWEPCDQNLCAPGIPRRGISTTEIGTSGPTHVGGALGNSGE